MTGCACLYERTKRTNLSSAKLSFVSSHWWHLCSSRPGRDETILLIVFLFHNEQHLLEEAIEFSLSPPIKQKWYNLTSPFDYNQVRKTNWRFSPGWSLSLTNLRVQSGSRESWGESWSQISTDLQRRSHSEAREPAWIELLDERLQHLNIYRWATNAIRCCPWRTKKLYVLSEKIQEANI